jgi:YegS/Rv2252/BmrU family lipid kinase
MPIPYQNVHVIINPAAGQDEPILNTLNDVFRQHGVKWEASITHAFGDATRMARTAVEAGVDLVVGYGGDGTQMEIANGVMGSDTPMAILPGGTGNAMAFELGIPRELRGAAELLCQSHNKRKIDLGQIGDHIFMLRTYTGPGPEQVASRDLKDKYGVLAYPAASLRIIKNLPNTHYRLTMDGYVVEDSAFVCTLFNAGSLGGVNLPGLPEIDPGDGMLDVLLITRGVRSFGMVALYSLDLGFGKAHVHHWKAKQVTVEVETPQTVWIDGESHGYTPFTAVVLPQAVQIVAPEP